MQINDKVALVTGGASGPGLAPKRWRRIVDTEDGHEAVTVTALVEVRALGWAGR